MQQLKPTEILRLYWRFAWRHKKLVIGLMVSVPLAMLTFRFLPSLVVANILQRLSTGEYTDGQLWQSFGSSLLLYIFLVAFGGILMWRLAVIFIWKLEMRVIQDIHEHIFDHLLKQSADFHANRFGGSLVTQANKLASSYVRIADTFTFQAAGLVLSFVFTIILLAPRAPLIVLFLILFSILYMVIAILITKRMRVLGAIEANTASRQTGYLADVVTNIMAVKSFAATTFERIRYREATAATRSATNDVMLAGTKRDIVFSSSTTLLSSVSLILAVAGVVLWNADIATVFLAITYTGVIGENLWTFSQQTLRNFNRAVGDAKDMSEILQIQPAVEDPAKPEKVRIARGDIRFDSVSFSYKQGEQEALFDDFNLHVKPGEKVGLVGHSGSGKTSLTKLLLRFSDVQKGEILIDGQNIRHITQDDLRRNIAYVPQEPLLFHRSLRENIRYGQPDATDQEIEIIARSAHAHDFITALPEGYDTLVGERGVKLSGGQRQRIAIARAMIKNAPILVLDEATSALDSESEALIQDALWKLMQDRTAIVIAHRLSTIQKLDRIIVLDQGTIVEQGSHKELLGANRTYAALWNHQTGGFIEE
ncbi:MAG TPA: ABC transporter ATP-binding protein [Candidatus Limnocylindrales bacterium]|nr:ABC transporter ATP-binding protein [Candidatus Limnocylindrales bacterium]